MIPLECIAFMLIKDDNVLAERRKLTRKVEPGAIALPGGHVDPGENPEDTLYRESKEELGILPNQIRYVCTLLHQSQEFRKIHYYAVESWEGMIEIHEADSLLWIPLTEPEHLDIFVDRIAISEYQRIYLSNALPI